jgi:hypothetical protein
MAKEASLFLGKGFKWINVVGSPGTLCGPIRKWSSADYYFGLAKRLESRLKRRYANHY